MSTNDTPIRFRKKRLQAYRGRGQLYSWLRAHRETIAQGFTVGKLTWPVVCAECGRHGVTSRDGTEPSQRAAAKAWQTLLHDLETLGLKSTDKIQKPIYPSRMAKWTPPSILEALEAGNPAVEGVRVSGTNVPVAAAPSTGTALATRAPPPRPPAPPPEAPAEGKLLSQYAKPGDSIEMQRKLRAAEDQLKKADRWMFKE